MAMWINTSACLSTLPCENNLDIEQENTRDQRKLKLAHQLFHVCINADVFE